MNSGIYIIQHVNSRKVYIGSSANLAKRWRNHKMDLKLNRHHCLHLQNAYNKHGVDAFHFQIVEQVEPTRSLLIAAEQRWMDMNADKLYNTCKKAGSVLGMKLTDEQRAKISVALKGKKKSATHIENNRLAQLQVPRNEENIQRWAHNRKGSTQTAEHIAKRAASLSAARQAETAQQKRSRYEKMARTKGSLVTIDEVEYLSYKDASKQLGIPACRLKSLYPKMSPTVFPVK